MARWDALAGSGATRTTKKASRFNLREVEEAYKLGITLPRATVLPSPASDEEEASPSAADGIVDEGYLSADEIRGELLSRFESSRVEMLDKETLILIGPDGKKEYFVKQKQMAKKTGVSAPALEGAFSSASFPS